MHYADEGSVGMYGVDMSGAGVHKVLCFFDSEKLIFDIRKKRKVFLVYVAELFYASHSVRAKFNPSSHLDPSLSICRKYKF